jgi:hypothetical protein
LISVRSTAMFLPALYSPEARSSTARTTTASQPLLWTSTGVSPADT